MPVIVVANTGYYEEITVAEMKSCLNSNGIHGEIHIAQNES